MIGCHFFLVWYLIIGALKGILLTLFGVDYIDVTNKTIETQGFIFLIKNVKIVQGIFQRQIKYWSQGELGGWLSKEKLPSQNFSNV